MSVFHLLVVVIAIVLAFWANNRYLTGIFRTLVNVILIIVCLYIVFELTGVINTSSGIRLS